jgi:hypothetical protein
MTKAARNHVDHDVNFMIDAGCDAAGAPGGDGMK